MNTTSDAHGSGTSPESLSNSEAQELLARAERMGRNAAPTVPAVLITYGILCTMGTFGIIGLHLASMIPETRDFSPTLAVLLPMLAWLVIAVLASLLFRQRLRRGMGGRWILLMAVWGVLWVAGVLLSATIWGFYLALFFVIPFVMAFTSEAQRAKNAADAAEEAR